MTRLLSGAILGIVSGLITVFALGGAHPGAAAPSAEKKTGPPVVRAAECRWASGPIKIDGTLDEPAWQKADVVKDFAA